MRFYGEECDCHESRVDRRLDRIEAKLDRLLALREAAAERRGFLAGIEAAVANSEIIGTSIAKVIRTLASAEAQ
jgi:hypothetical protein